jgi:hypothetical protein
MPAILPHAWVVNCQQETVFQMIHEIPSFCHVLNLGSHVGVALGKGREQGTQKVGCSEPLTGMGVEVEFTSGRV